MSQEKGENGVLCYNSENSENTPKKNHFIDNKPNTNINTNIIVSNETNTNYTNYTNIISLLGEPKDKVEKIAILPLIS
jgi:hypothetical protein